MGGGGAFFRSGQTNKAGRSALQEVGEAGSGPTKNPEKRRAMWASDTKNFSSHDGAIAQFALCCVDFTGLAKTKNSAQSLLTKNQDGV